MSHGTSKKKDARRKFPDEWTASMKYKDFAEWCILRKFHSAGGVPLELDENDPEATLKDAAGAGSLGGIIKAFQDWDTDGNGSITAEELKTILQSLDDSFTEEQVENLMKSADTNEDGKIDYVEFSNWIVQADEPAE